MCRLAAAFAGLETTRSRRAMVQLLAELCREAAPDDLAVVLYLTQGRLRPAYETIEIGLGEQTIVRGLAGAYQTPLERVVQVSAQLGDVGLAAEQLNPGEQSELPVSIVYDTLIEVARTAGRGSSEQRVQRLVDLFARLGRLEARYVARICLGRLRLGVGDATLLDGLAAAFGTDRGPLERAYSLHPDLGWLGEALASGGALEPVHPEPGVPILPALAERLPSAEAILARLGPCLVEPKYDGLRVQLHRDGDRVWLFSRRLENLTEMLPEIVQAVPQQITPQRCIMEGEALAYNPETQEFLPFQITAQRRRKHSVEEMTARYPLRLFLFDLMLEGNNDETPRTLGERRDALLAAVKPAPDRPIDVTRGQVVNDAEALDRFFDESIARVGSGLTEENWVRLRELLAQVRAPQQPARVVSRLTPDIWVEPTYVVEVQADEITRSPMHTAGQTPGEPGYALRFPRMIGWLRADKTPEDATTVAEILRMYAQQRRLRQE